MSRVEFGAVRQMRQFFSGFLAAGFFLPFASPLAAGAGAGASAAGESQAGGLGELEACPTANLRLHPPESPPELSRR